MTESLLIASYFQHRKNLLTKCSYCLRDMRNTSYHLKDSSDRDTDLYACKIFNLDVTERIAFLFKNQVYTIPAFPKLFKKLFNLSEKNE